MGLFDIFKKKKAAEEETVRVAGMEDFMTLLRVYYQATMASNLGITNLAFLPDMAVFKRSLKIPTLNNKLGVAERSRCKKMMSQIYGVEDNFFKEVDQSIKKNCRNVNDVKNYFLMFQDFSQNLMMLIGNLMKWKFRMPSLFKKALYTLTEKAINDIMTKNDWKDEAVFKTCTSIRKYQHTLGYSQKWMTDYVYQIVLLAKKEPKPKNED
jgi:hypothetical protein